MNYWQEKVLVGKLQIPRFIGAPLDGITDSPFRKLVRDFSKDNLLYSEMRHVGSIVHEKSAASFSFEQLERPINFQIAAKDERFVKEACEKISAMGVDLVDLNIGCPARAVIRNGSGSALMADLPRLIKILDLMRTSLSVPFTVKMRAGYKLQNACDVARVIEGCGAAALAIHPRLQTQMFAGRPDFAVAAAVKKAVTIPVFLSGNVINFKTAQLAYNQTGVDGFLVGRGMWSRPWKLHEMQMHAEGKTFDISKEVIVSYAQKHLDWLLAYYGSIGLRQFRKHIPLYIREFENAAQVRERLVRLEEVNEVKEGLQELLKERNELVL
jgi:tRNA-dihydrouridine synthase B